MKYYINAGKQLVTEAYFRFMPNRETRIEECEVVELAEDADVIDIPDGVNYVAELGEFPRATMLRLPASVQAVFDSLTRCKSLTRIEVDGKNPWLCARDGMLLSKDGKRMHRIALACERVVIPSSVQDIDYGMLNYPSSQISLEVDPENKTFFMENGMLYSRIDMRLKYVPLFAKRLEIPEGIMGIDECCSMLGRHLESVSLPSTVRELNGKTFGSLPPFALTIHNTLEKCDTADFPMSIGQNTAKLTSLTVIGRWTDAMTKGFSRVQIPVIHVNDIGPVPAGKRPAAAVGFAEDGRDTSTPEGQAYCKYIRVNSGKLIEAAFEHPMLLRLMCAEGLILPKHLDAYRAEAEKRGDIESHAMLLNAMNTAQGEVTKARAKKAEKAQKDAEVVLEQAVSRAARQGISGMRFALTGTLMKEGFYWEEEMERKEVERWLNSYGAELAAAITAKTDALIVGKKPDKKRQDKANELGIEQIQQPELKKRAAQGNCVRWIVDGRLEIAQPSSEGERWEFAPDAEALTLPEAVVEIGDYAFCDCKSLTQIQLPKGLRRIGCDAFYRCINLKEIEFPSELEAIGDEAFTFCKSLERVTLPEGMKTLGQWAFSECGALTSIEVPGSIERLERGTFYDEKCHQKLKSIVLGEGIRVIDVHALGNCTEVETLILPESVVELGELAMMDMKKLKSLTLGPNIERIGKDVLMRVNRINELTVRGGWTDAMTKRFAGMTFDCINIDDIASLPRKMQKIAKRRDYL